MNNKKSPLDPIVRVVCEHPTCNRQGTAINTVDGFNTIEAADNFVEQFHDAHDCGADYCPECGELGTAEAGWRCNLIDPDAVPHTLVVEALTDDSDGPFAVRMTVTGPATVEEFPDIWDAALDAVKRNQPNDWQFDDLEQMLEHWGFTLRALDAPDVRVTY